MLVSSDRTTVKSWNDNEPAYIGIYLLMMQLHRYPTRVRICIEIEDGAIIFREIHTEKFNGKKKLL